MSKREIPIDDLQDSGVEENETQQTSNVGDLEERLSALELENQRLRDQAIRAVADLENFRRRAVQEREQVMQYSNERLLQSILPVVDDFGRSVESGEQNKDFPSFYQGVLMIYNKLLKILDVQGVKRIEALGQPFDVDLHEALMRQPSDAPEDTVISELEAGYTYGDRVLRHAKVIVSAGS